MVTLKKWKICCPRGLELVIEIMWDTLSFIFMKVNVYNYFIVSIDNSVVVVVVVVVVVDNDYDYVCCTEL